MEHPPASTAQLRTLCPATARHWIHAGLCARTRNCEKQKTKAYKSAAPPLPTTARWFGQYFVRAFFSSPPSVGLHLGTVKRAPIRRSCAALRRPARRTGSCRTLRLTRRGPGGLCGTLCRHSTSGARSQRAAWRLFPPPWHHLPHSGDRCLWHFAGI